METVTLPASYLTFTITNNTGLPDTALYVFLQSQTQIYQITGQVAAPVTSPADGNAPSVTLFQLKNSDGTYSFYVDSTQQLTSGRLYFSDSATAVQISGTNSINGPSPDTNFNFDFVEFTLNAGSAINLDTTQIDQFGMPITVQVNPADTSFPNGTGTILEMSRAGIIKNFKTFTKNASFKAYADCAPAVTSGTPYPVDRLLGPQHVLDNQMPQTQLEGTISNASVNKTQPWTAQFNVSGNWAGGATVLVANALQGNMAAGAGIPAGATVVSNTSDTVQLTSYIAPFSDTSNTLSLAFYTAPTGSSLHSVFDAAIFELFDYYKKNTLYLAANGTNSGMEIYSGQVITDFTLPSGLTDINGNADTEYIVFQFTGTGYRYNAANNTLTALPALPAGQTNVYQVFYPYFSTNMFMPVLGTNPVPPPVWWKPGWGAAIPVSDGGPLGNLNFISPASQMVFACNGVFADNAYQAYAYSSSTSTQLQDETVLGNIQNQLVTMLNRGINPGALLKSNLYQKIGYVAASDINPNNLGNNYATLHILDPNNPAQPYTFTGNLGNTTAGIEVGMQMTTLANFSQPFYVHSIVDTTTIIIYSPIAFNPTTGTGAFNTGILSFGFFYPFGKDNAPIGNWNAYAYYFHNGDLGKHIPTIDGRGYAFPFDDNGGYSSDLQVNFTTGTPAVTVDITLNPWEASVL